MEPSTDITEIPQTAEPASVQKSEPSPVPEQRQIEPEGSDQNVPDNSGENISDQNDSVEKDVLGELESTSNADVKIISSDDDKSEKTEKSCGVVEDVSKVESKDVVMKGDDVCDDDDKDAKPTSPKVTAEQSKGKQKFLKLNRSLVAGLVDARDGQANILVNIKFGGSLCLVATRGDLRIRGS